MSGTSDNREPDFADKPDFQALTDSQKRLLVEIMDKMLTMGIFAVYGDEAQTRPDSRVLRAVLARVQGCMLQAQFCLDQG